MYYKHGGLSQQRTKDEASGINETVLIKHGTCTQALANQILSDIRSSTPV